MLDIYPRIFKFGHVPNKCFNIDRSEKPHIRVRGSCSHGSKTQMEDKKEQDTRKKGKMSELKK